MTGPTDDELSRLFDSAELYDIPVGPNGKIDTEALINSVLDALTRNEIIVVSAGALYRLLEFVGPRVLPEVTAEQWRGLATAAVAEGLTFARDRQQDEGAPPRHR